MLRFVYELSLAIFLRSTELHAASGKFGAEIGGRSADVVSELSLTFLSAPLALGNPHPIQSLIDINLVNYKY
jgi:hypothetical protein